MNDYSIQGVGSMSGGEFRDLNVEGVGTNNGDIKAERVIVEGVFKSTGHIDVDTYDCEGVTDLYGGLRAKRVINEGVINVKGEDKIEAQEIVSEGCINTKGDVYADIIRIDGCICAKGIYGDNIDIQSKHSVPSGIKKLIKLLPGQHSNGVSVVDTIEATKIMLKGVEAKSVCGQDVIIGPGCVIDTVDCSNVLKIHESSTVKTILGAKPTEN